MSNPDVLSRVPLKKSLPTLVLVSGEKYTGLSFFSSHQWWMQKIWINYTIIFKILTFVQLGWPDRNSNDIVKQYFTDKDEIIVQNACHLWGIELCVLVNNRQRHWKLCSRLYYMLFSCIPWNSLKPIVWHSFGLRRTLWGKDVPYYYVWIFKMVRCISSVNIKHYNWKVALYRLLDQPSLSLV